MRKSLLLYMLLAVSFLPSYAEKRTKEQIISAAKAVLSANNQSNYRLKTSNYSNVVILDDSYSQLSIVGYNNGSYAVVSKDDKFPAIFGYTVSSVSFDKSKLAPAFLWLLDRYNKFMESKLQSGEPVEYYYPKSDLKPEVPPMMTTQWSQEVPYNNQTPKIGNTNNHYVTGCVATAMAQLMRYHKYPETGRGVSRYRFTDDDGKTKRVSVNMAERPFRWDDMIDNYSTSRYDDDQAFAVSYLMKCTGAATKMRYGIHGSAAYTSDAAYALYHYFNYDITTECYQGDWMNEDEWKNMVYESLNNGNPVLFGAESSIGGQDAGHAFVVDGYNSDGLVHVNFGWAGDSDNYYSLLNMHGYDHGFEIVLTKKPEPNSFPKSYMSIYPGGDFKYVQNTRQLSAVIINTSAKEFTGSVAIILQNLSDGSQIVLGEDMYDDLSMDIMTDQGLAYNIKRFTYTVNFPSDLADGDYRMFLASKGSFEIFEDPTNDKSSKTLYTEPYWQPLRSGDGTKNSCLVYVRNSVISTKAEKDSGWVTSVDNASVNNTNNNEYVNVYDLQGRKLYSSLAVNFKISDIPATGVLIIKNGGSTKKIIKR